MAYQTPRAGELRHVITIERKATVSDGMGGVKETAWTPWLTVRAKIAAVKGDEVVQSQRLSGVVNYDLTARWSPDLDKVTPGDRAIDAKGLVYDIRAIVNLDNRSKYLVMICETGTVSNGG